MTKTLLLVFVHFVSQILIAQTSSQFAVKKFSADTVIYVIDDITRELSIKHPGFYRYNSKAAFGGYIDSVKHTIKDSLTVLESFRKLKPIISKIGCLHTDLGLGKENSDSLNQQPSLLPFQLYFIDNRAYVKKNHSNNKSIAAGDEILSINGKKIEIILKQILPAIPSDGYNLTMKYRALYYQFPAWYRSMIENTSDFTVVTKHANKEVTNQLKGATFNEIAESGFLKEPVRAKQLEFEIKNDIGLLTIHSFAKSDIKRSDQKFKKFIGQTFKEIKARNIRNLVVDLRDNTGGSDSYAAHFTSYFFDKPFRYWDRIEVTDAISKQIKGAVKLFYKKPIHKDSAWIWRKGNFTKEFDFYTNQKPAKNNYNGKTYVLTNGFCMSSCADVAAILAHNKKATFIGEETGGGYQGNNSGMIPTTKLTPLNFSLSVPLQAYFNHVDSSKNIGRGTIPDYRITDSIDDLIKDHDKSLDFALELIKKDAR